MKRIVGGFVLFSGVAALCCAPLLARAEDEADLRDQLAASKASHAALVKKSQDLNSEVESLRNKLVAVSGDLRVSEENLSETALRLENLRQQKAACLQNLYADQAAMGGLVSAVQKYSRTSTPSLLIQGDPLNAARASLIMKSMLPGLQQQSIYLKSQLAEISKIEQDIAEQQQIQTEQNKKLNKQQDKLTLLLEERKKLYQRTENERQSLEKEVVRLTKESKNLEDLMERLKESSREKKTAGHTLPANILLPVHGSVRMGFGDKDEMGGSSKGLTLATRPGASVVVPLAGVVKFAGPFQKFKQILIVEHRGGYHSLIAGLARIDTVVGASLAAGEPVGVTDTSDSPQIYYELRQNGKPVNPQKLLVAQRKQEKS